MKRAGAFLALAGFLVVGTASVFAQSTTSEVRTAINRGNAAFIKAYKDGDALALAAIFDENGARLLRGGVILRGRAAIQADAAKDFKELGPLELTIETSDVWVLDDVAYETGNFTFTAEPPGEEPRTMTGRYAVSWKKQNDGSWKMLTEISAPIDQCTASGTAIARKVD